MSYGKLFLYYSLDLTWLFLAFAYAFVVLISNIFGVPINKSLSENRAIVALILIALWFKYVYADAYHVLLWLNESKNISQADIDEKADRELLSLVTSIVNTLLVAGCKFKINVPKFLTKKKDLH